MDEIKMHSPTVAAFFIMYIIYTVSSTKSSFTQRWLLEGELEPLLLFFTLLLVALYTSTV